MVIVYDEVKDRDTVIGSVCRSCGAFVPEGGFYTFEDDFEKKHMFQEIHTQFHQ